MQDYVIIIRLTKNVLSVKRLNPRLRLMTCINVVKSVCRYMLALLKLSIEGKAKFHCIIIAISGVVRHFI